MEIQKLKKDSGDTILIKPTKVIIMGIGFLIKEIRLKMKDMSHDERIGLIRILMEGYYES